MSETIITSDNFEEEVLKSNKPVLVDFWATWCGPCKMTAPHLEAFAESRPDIKVGKVDVDKDAPLAVKYNITAVPTFILFKEGKLVKQASGFMDKTGLEKFMG